MPKFLFVHHVSITFVVLYMCTLGYFLKASQQMQVKRPPDIADAVHLPHVSTEDDYVSILKNMSVPWIDMRLPKNVVPLHYDLCIYPHIHDDIFNGTVTITVSVNEITNFLVVHALDLKILDYSVYRDKDNVEVPVEELYVNNTQEYVVMMLRENIDPTVYKIFFNFSGMLVTRPPNVGFYKHTSFNTKGEAMTYYSTKFEPTYARKAFPCFDEPMFRSTFNISVVHHPTYLALSNMPIRETEPYGESLLVTHFEKSVPMVTYLLCWAVCKFEYKEVITSDGKPFRVYAPPDEINTTDFALAFGVKALKYYEDYFGVKYTLPKLDMIALEGHHSGGTEHWGIISFSKVTLLHNQTSESPNKKQSIAATVAHELVQMWFGDLVTMEWWDDIWLNEGFASYLEYRAVDDQFPDWDMCVQYVTESMYQVLDMDSYDDTHPIVQPLTTQQQIVKRFDGITYDKASAVIRMLEYIVGEKYFRNTLTNYLRKYQNKIVTSNDLWEEFNEVCADKLPGNISSIMSAWMTKKGYPYVTVKRNPENPSLFHATQRRFIIDEATNKDSQNDTEECKWSIPLTYITSKNETGLIWMHEIEESFVIPGVESQWVKFNVNQTGFYIVNYEDKDWNRLIELLKDNHEALSPLNRANLLFDFFLLAEKGLCKFDTFLTMSIYLKNERHLTPWTTMIRLLKYMERQLEKINANSLFKGYKQDLTHSLYQSIEWKTYDDHLKAKMQAVLIRLACDSDYDECLQDARNIFNNKTALEQLPHSLKEYVISVVNRTLSTYDNYYDIVNQEKSPRPSLFPFDSTLHKHRPLMNNPYLKLEFKGICERPEVTGICYKKFFSPREDPKTCEETWLPTYSHEVKEWLLSNTAPWRCSRLSPDVIPEHYYVTWHLPSNGDDVFSGSVNITITLQRPTDSFVVHFLDLNITKSEVRSEDNAPVDIEKTFAYDPNQYWVVKAQSVQDAGKYTLYFEFEGKSENASGLYRKSYDSPGQNGTGSLTIIMPLLMGTRRLFPCFDEPSYNTTFSVSVVHDSSLYVVSNSEVKESLELEGGLTRTTFEKTLAIAIHSIRVVASDFKTKETVTENGFNGTKLRLHTAAHKFSEAEYISDIIPKLMSFFEIYLDYPYPLEKLDVVAAPEITESVSTSWGILIFDENVLLRGDDCSIFDKYQIAWQISYALGKMWLSTHFMPSKWCSNSWMEESFPAYMAAKSLQQVDQEWNLENIFVEEFLYPVLIYDTTPNSFPMGKMPSYSEKVLNLFYRVSLEKGVSLLRMLDEVLREGFRIAITSFLKNYNFGTGNVEDLWEELKTQFAAKHNLDVPNILDTWITQMNYPYLAVIRDKNNETYLNVRQERFLRDTITEENRFVSSLGSDPHYEYVWKIPVSFRKPVTTGFVILNTEKAKFPLAAEGNDDWVKFNANFSGIYVVNYDMNTWSYFVKLLIQNPYILGASDRANLLFDAFQIASAGLLDYEVPLNMTFYLRQERHPTPWFIALHFLDSITQNLKDEKANHDLMKERVRNLAKDLLAEYTWNNTGGFLERKLRLLLIRATCGSGDHDCLKIAHDLFLRWFNGERPNVDMRVVCMYGLKLSCTEDMWNELLIRFLQEKNFKQKEHLMIALTSVSNSTLLEKLLVNAVDGNFLEDDFLSILQGIANNPDGYNSIYYFLLRKWSYLFEKFSESEKLKYFLKSVLSRLNTYKDLKKAGKFYQGMKLGNIHRSRALDDIKITINWLKNRKANVTEWLNNNVYVPWKNVRLPDYIRPSRYNLVFHPNLTLLTFKGEMHIEVEVQKPTDLMMIHQDGLDIAETELKHDGAVIDIHETFPYQRNHFWVIRFKHMIPPGNYSLRLLYSGTFSDTSKGLRRYSYVHSDTEEKRYLAATQFDPTLARNALPCFDEPSLKSRIKFSIIHDATFSPVSNMPEESRDFIDEGIVKTTFVESVPMSTYLLFWVISDFDFLESKHNEIMVRVYTRPDKIQQAEHALNKTVLILAKYEEFFDIPYALPKLDSIGIPDYATAAMEHWGAIAYNDARLLVNEEMSQDKILHSVDQVISHELAHQWFGNLVTMKWWNDLWLNEGFSTFAMYIPLKDFYPNIDELRVQKLFSLICRDSFIVSNPIIQDVTYPEQIHSMFNHRTYEKGGAIVNVLHHFFKDDFRKGLTNYLKKYAYSNAETKDFCQELSNALHVDVDIVDVINTWTTQMGFPHVRIEREGDEFTATQELFARSNLGAAVNESALRYIWKIPLTCRIMNTGEKHQIWLNEKNATFEISESSGKVVIFNPGFIGYYLVEYEEKDWKKISHYLMENHEAFSTFDRYGLLYNAYLLAISHRTSFEMALEISKYLKHEREELPWKVFVIFVKYILERVEYTSETSPLLKKFLADLTEYVYDAYVLPPRSFSYYTFEEHYIYWSCLPHHDIDYHPKIIELACYSYNEKCLSIINNELQLWKKSENVTADLGIVLKLGAERFGDAVLWDQMYNRLFTENVTELEATNLLRGLASFTDPELIQRTVDVVLNESGKVPYDVIKLAGYLVDNPNFISLIWDQMESNWTIIIERLISSKPYFFTIFCNKFKTDRQFEKVKLFLMDHLDMKSEQKEHCLKLIKINMQWIRINGKEILNWLQLNAS